MDPKISFIPAAEAAVSPIVEEHVAKVEAVKEEENTEQVVEINNNQEGVVKNEKEGTPAKPAAKIPKKIDYNVDFPGLPTIQATTKASGPWIKPIVRKLETSKVVHLTMEERGGHSRNAALERNHCHEIEKTSGAKIEIYEAKDGSVSFHIRGKPADVEKARASLSRKVKAQITREIIVPKDQHRVFIGKQGAQRMKYEQDLNCKIEFPKPQENSDVTKITGASEDVARAVKVLQAKSNEISASGRAEFDIPKKFYPWIRGPQGELYDKWTAQGVKINIPPPTAHSDVIIITGPRVAVDQVAAEIQAIYAGKKDTVKTMTAKVAQTQHRYIIGSRGSGIHEIFRETDVVVEVPSEEEKSDVITLHGEQSKLGLALAQIYSKAASHVSTNIKCPMWMHKKLIGPKGATLEKLVPESKEFNNLKVEFEDGGVIYIEGSPDKVKNAQVALQAEIGRLEKTETSEVIKVDPKYHKHIIGRNRSVLNKICGENTNVHVQVPDEGKHSFEIRVEGDRVLVQKVIKEIQKIVARLDNEKSKDLIIPHRIHGQLIGKNGDGVKAYREKYPSVVISFPEKDCEESDKITLRGDRIEVDAVAKGFEKKAKELFESDYQETIPVFSEFHKHIIGKGGNNISKLREGYTVRITLPPQNSDENVITVTGKKGEVEKIVKELEKMQNELSKIVEQEVTIPAKVHFRFVASSRQVVKEIEKNCGGVHIKFPAEKSNSDKVSVRGPKDDVAKAVEELKKISKRFQETAFEDSIQAKADYHKFFIGRKGAKINELTAKYPSIRVVFPREDAADKEKIHFLGSKEDVAAVKKIFEKQITELNEKTEVGVEVDPKHHSHFVARYAQVLNSIQKDFCGVVISFPKKGTDDKNVTIKGAKQAVEGAKQRILEIVDDLENQVIISMDIEAKHRPSFFRDLGDKTTRVQVVEDEFNVQIKFPPRPPKTAEGKPVPPTESEVVDDEVKISGRAENCEKAKEALLAFVPIKKTVEVSLDLHRGLIGEKGAIVNSISQAHHVRIIFPKNDEQKDAITIEGVASDVEEATKTVFEHIERLEKEAEDKKLKSFRLDVVIDPKHHQRLIGIRGANVNKIREAHDVRISFPDTRHKDADDRKPRKDFRDPNAGPDVIIIVGYEAACKEVEKIFLDDVEKYESQYTEEVELDPRFHPKLIGRQSQNLKKLQSEYEVEIRIPRKTAENPSLVVVAGEEDNVCRCIERLRIDEEDFMQDVIVQYGYISTRKEPLPKRQLQDFLKQPKDFKGDFPSFGGEGGVSAPASGVWGRNQGE